MAKVIRLLIWTLAVGRQGGVTKMKRTLITILAGLSLIPSIASPKPSEPKMDPLVVRIVELLKADPATSHNSQETRASDFFHCSATAICPAKSGILISYTKKFKEGNKLIVIEYIDYDDKTSENTPPYFQSDGMIGPADFLTINITSNQVKGKRLGNYGLTDEGLDKILDSYYGDVLELGVSGKEAEDYYAEKRTEIEQKYTTLLKEIEKRLTKKNK